MALVRECPRSLKYCLIQRRQASWQAQFIPKIYECWEQILGSQTFLSWRWIWIIHFRCQKGVIFHLQCISQRWKYEGRYFPGAVNTWTSQSNLRETEIPNSSQGGFGWVRKKCLIFFFFLNILFFLLCLLVWKSSIDTKKNYKNCIGQNVICDLSQAGQATRKERNSATCSSSL